MLQKLLSYFKPQSLPEPINEKPKRDIPLPEEDDHHQITFNQMLERAFQRTAVQDIVSTGPAGATMDENIQTGLFGPSVGLLQNTVPNSLLYWFGNQTFIGYQMCAIIAQHWLVLKCCDTPALDATRQGYTITQNDGTEIEQEILDAIAQADLRYDLNNSLKEYITKGNMFGFRIMLFEVESDDPDYYLKPFNIDGITPDSYKGMVQIDPYWITPELDFDSGADPSSRFFYEPTWWRVNAKRIHRTHLCIFRNGELADLLKPTYLYGGVPVPQQIYERVYCAERTANEVPQLAMTKRIGVIFTDAAAFLANQGEATQNIQQFTTMMNNYGQKILDKVNDDYKQFDVTLAHLDEVITGQYLLVAAAAGIPYTKLLGTAPKGLNATGEYDEASYHEKVKSLQTSALSPAVERHHELVIRSEIVPRFGIAPFKTKTVWKPLDERTAEEQATLNKTNAEADQINIQNGVISPNEARDRLINDVDSGYNGLASDEAPGGEGGDPLEPGKGSEFEEGINEDPDPNTTLFEKS